MTLNELRSHAATLAGLPSVNADPFFANAVDGWLNDAQVRYGKRYGIPVARFEGNVAANPLVLNPPPMDMGVFSVLDIDAGKRLRVLDEYEADSLMPDRGSDTGRPAIVEMRRTDGNRLYFWPAPDASYAYRIIYTAMPQRMERGNDEPWNGQYPEFHDLIALKVATDYALAGLGRDAEHEESADQNPYAPMNRIRFLKARLMEREAAVDAELSTTSIPTAGAFIDTHTAGYRY